MAVAKRISLSYTCRYASILNQTTELKKQDSTLKKLTKITPKTSTSWRSKDNWQRECTVVMSTKISWLQLAVLMLITLAIFTTMSWNKLWKKSYCKQVNSSKDYNPHSI